jgi:hypothetical protein
LNFIFRSYGVSLNLYTEDNRATHRKSLLTGVDIRLTEPEESPIAHGVPRLLPEGEAFLFLRFSPDTGKMEQKSDFLICETTALGRS